MAWHKYFTVEVPLLFCMFAMILQGAVYTNLYVYRTCYVILGYNQSDCAQLGNVVNNVTADLEPKVQPTVNYIHMAQTVTGTLFPMPFSMYVGTWSDKFGRKPFLLLCLIGVIITTIGNTIIVHFENTSPWWFIITNIPSLVTGGVHTMFIVISAYIVDVTTPKDRVVRLSIFELIMGIASFFGNLLSSYLFYATSYEMIFIIAVGLQVASFLYTLFFIKESIKGDKKIPKVGEVLNHINFKDIIKDAIRKRENNARSYLLAIIGIQLVLGFAGGESSVSSLYLRAKLHWTLKKITTVSSVTSVGFMLGTLLGTFLLYKTFKIKEFHLALFATVASAVANLLRGLATNDYYIYTAHAVTIFFGLTGLMFRTIISYMVPSDEMGKLFAAMGILQSLLSMVSSEVYPLIYNATLYTNSGIYNFVSLGIHIGVIIAMMFMLKLQFPYYQAPPDPELKENTENLSPKISLNINNIEVSSVNEASAIKRTSLAPAVDTRSLTSSSLNI